MKLSEYREKLSQNPEYVEAEKGLRIRFAFANAVLSERIKKGWSQAELAEAVGTKQANISRIEAGLANPTLDLIQRLCETLDLELELIPRNQMETEGLLVSNPSSITGVSIRTVELVENQ